MKVLIVEDEVYIAKPMADVLKKNNYNVDLAFDGEEGLYQSLNGVHDLILLDIMLPKIDGLEVLRKLRKAGIQTPIIMLTARDQVEDKIAGLDSGADDYLPKPFVYAELLARMRALSRRGMAIRESNTFKVADLELNVHGLILTSKNVSITLPKKEAQLLELLISRRKMATPKDLIIEKLWEFDSDVASNNVEYHISNLRKKMKSLNSKVTIKNMRGVGYVLKEG